MCPSSSVPHITTAMQGPLQEFEKKALNQSTKIESWLREQWKIHRPPIYGSVDIRNAGYKMAPVDTNLFPAGFNNLNPDFQPLCIQAFQHYLSQHYPNCSKVCLLAETHVRNPHYFENLATLSQLLTHAGYLTLIGSCHPELTASKTIALKNGESITLHPIQSDGQRIMVNNTDVCIIISNNDFSAGLPDRLNNIRQPIIPSPLLGWASRRKSQHFDFYNQLCKQLADIIGIDPWLISSHHEAFDDIDFNAPADISQLQDAADTMLQSLTKQYQECGIENRPFVVIKADQGTYGMGVMMIHDANELNTLNRKQRQRMSQGKGGQKNTKIIVQEGVYTGEYWQTPEQMAEPVVYMVGHEVVGGFYRVHAEKASHENLNAPGMSFKPLAFASPCNRPNQQLDCSAEPNRFYMYGMIARLAMAAATKEFICLSN